MDQILYGENRNPHAEVKREKNRNTNISFVFLLRILFRYSKINTCPLTVHSVLELFCQDLYRKQRWNSGGWIWWSGGVKHNGMCGLCFPEWLHLALLWGHCVGTLCGDSGTALHHLLTSALSVCAVKASPRETHRKVPWQGSCIGMGRAQPLPTQPTLAAQHKQKEEEVPTVSTNRESYTCRKIRRSNLPGHLIN